MEIGDILEELDHSQRFHFSPGGEAFLLSLRHEDLSSAIGQRFDRFSRFERGIVLSLATIARRPNNRREYRRK